MTVCDAGVVTEKSPLLAAKRRHALSILGLLRNQLPLRPYLLASLLLSHSTHLLLQRRHLQDVLSKCLTAFLH